MSDFDHDYVEFDGFGILSILCMRCATKIAERTYVDVPSRLEPGKTVKAVTLERLSNWREAWVQFADGGNAILKLCKECEGFALDAASGRKIVGQFKRAWERENRDNPIPPEEARRQKNRFDAAVVVGMTPDDKKPDVSRVRERRK